MEGIWVVAFALQWALLLMLTVLVAGVLRYLQSVRERISLIAPPISFLEVGERIPAFSSHDLQGRSVTRDDLLRHARPIVLLFLSPGCPACKALLEQVSELGRRAGGIDALRSSFALACAGESSDIRSMVQDHPELLSDDVTILLDMGGEVGGRFGIRSSPVGIITDAGGRVTSQSFNPHANWLYRVLGVLPPATPFTGKEAGAPESYMVPAWFPSTE